MAEAAGGGSEGFREPHSQLFPDALAKVSLVFGTHLADVFVKHREVETLTGEKNVIGRQNLVETLAHLSILFARAPELDRDKQLEQVAFFNDHLRRVMMESFEVYVYVMVAEHWDNTEPKSVKATEDLKAAAEKMKDLKLRMGAAVDAANETPRSYEARTDRDIALFVLDPRWVVYIRKIYVRGL